MKQFYNDEILKDWETACAGHTLNVTRASKHLLHKLRVTGRINVVDVGCNIGSYLTQIEEEFILGDVILIEPVSELIEIARNKFPAAIVINCCAGKENGSTTFYVDPTAHNLGLSKIFTNYTPDVNEQIISVEVKALTDILNNYGVIPDLIKSDAEGHDRDVLLGLVDYLIANEHIRPLIVFEQSPGYEIDDVLNIYYELGYSALPLDGIELIGDVFLIPAIHHSASL